MKITLSVYLILVFLFGTAHSVYAEEQITGAFGIKLGQLYHPKNCNPGPSLCKFKPEKNVRAFTNYQVSRTDSHKVYNIGASGNIRSKSDCTDEQDLVMAALEKKYGEEVELPNNALFREISQGHRRVRTSCSFGEIRIHYVDLMLLSIAMAEEERKKEEELRKNSEVIDTTDL